jgi:hypothetical protein
MLKLAAVLVSIFASLAALAQPRVDNVSPDTLRLLDQPGDYSFATAIGLGEAERTYLQERAGDPQFARLKLMRLADLYAQSPGVYQAIARLTRQDLEDDLIKKPGEPMAYSTEQAEKMAKDGKVPRYFDYYWLESKHAAMALVALVNRIDKRDFYPGTCGEVRFIYRFAYYRSDKLAGLDEPVESRSTMPMFLNVVYEYATDAQGGCSEIAKLWNDPSVTKPASAQSLVDALKAGPLAKERLRLKQIELNMQAVRYPSELKYDFGGQAIYLMRIFQEKDGVMTPIALENTINYAELKKSESLRRSLLAQISNPENLKKIDEGTFVLENTDGKLLSTRALSFTTVGRARIGNKPFSALYGADGAGLKSVDLSGLKFVKSAQGLVERLNNTTCMGCHQTGGTAGFHILGRAGNLSTPFNQVILPFSSHYLAERTRRVGYLQALVDGREPSRFRPLSFYPVQTGTSAQGLPSYNPGKTREFCLSAKQADFATGLTCSSGTACRLTAKNEAGGVDIGECVETPNVTAGNVCRRGVIKSAAMREDLGDLYNLFAIRDTIDATTKFNEDGGCTVPEQGVPLGRISRRCEVDSNAGRLNAIDAMKTAADKPKEMCVIQGGDVFDNCAKSSNPPKCLDDAAATIARANLDTCSDDHPCREDYICQQLPVAVSKQYSGSAREAVAKRIEKLAALRVGFCVPNYFVFNMRADGHILPEGRIAKEKQNP